MRQGLALNPIKNNTEAAFNLVQVRLQDAVWRQSES